jgi:hypothetical protein
MDKDSANKESAKGPEEWKERAPYSIHNDNEKFGALYEASCHCGKVSYQLNRKEPLDSKLCHCTTCQTQHAAPFQWAAIFHKEDINFTNGHQNLEWYDPSTKSIEHKLPCKVRCSFCHSPIMDEGRSMILLFPSLIHFPDNESKLNFKPRYICVLASFLQFFGSCLINFLRCHMFYGQRVMDIPDGLPKWTGLDKADDSELIEDSPPELVREYERKREDTRNEKKRKVEEEGGGANQAEKK